MSAENEASSFEKSPEAQMVKLDKAQEGELVTIETEGGTIRGVVTVALVGGLYLQLVDDQRRYIGSDVELTLNSAYRTSGSFVYQVYRKQSDGTMLLDESGKETGGVMMGGMRVSKKVKDVHIQK